MRKAATTFTFLRCVCSVCSSLYCLALCLFLCVFYFILIWLFADQRVTSDWVCPPPAASARNRIGCKIFIAICISHSEFAICIWMLLACELWIIHSLDAAADDSSIDLHWFAFQLHFFDTLQWIILQLHQLNAMRCDAATQCDVIYLWLPFKCICCCGTANNEAFVCNCLHLMIALELWQTDNCGAHMRHVCIFCICETNFQLRLEAVRLTHASWPHAYRLYFLFEYIFHIFRFSHFPLQ